MSRASVLAAARRFAAGGFTDTCTITRVTGQSLDRATGVTTPTTSAIYTGVCRAQQAAAMGDRVEAGEASVVVLRLELHLPVAGTASVDRGDTVQIAASPNDAALVGRVFRVRDLHHKTHASARRITMEEVT